MLGGCGATQETGGRAEGTKQTEEPEEKRQSEERQETQNDSDNEVSEILEFLGGDESEADEPERLVRPEELKLELWYEYEYDESGNQTKEAYYD